MLCSNTAKKLVCISRGEDELYLSLPISYQLCLSLSLWCHFWVRCHWLSSSPLGSVSNVTSRSRQTISKAQVTEKRWAVTWVPSTSEIGRSSRGNRDLARFHVFFKWLKLSCCAKAGWGTWLFWCKGAFKYSTDYWSQWVVSEILDGGNKLYHWYYC